MTLRCRRWPAVAAVPVLLLGLSCSSPSPTGRVCTLIGCEDGLKVDLEPGTGWPRGEYLFLIRADNVQVRCTGSVPLPACSAGRAVNCDVSGVVSIVESGCALPANAQGFPQIVFDPRLRPRQVDVSIVESSRLTNPVLATASFTPEFRTSQPNGPDCPLTCTQAQARLPVSLSLLGPGS